MDEQHTKCDFCKTALARYTCPKCNQWYCALACYRSDVHRGCSEQFYKDCVQAELSHPSSSSADDQKKMQEILVRLHDAEEQEDLDSDDDVEDLGTRLAGVDLDDSEQVWQQLNNEERQEFEAFLRSGDVSQFVTRWTPWWCKDSAQSMPQAWTTIRKFSDISVKSPAACVENNLVNIVAVYVFLTRYFNGEHNDFPLEFAVFGFNLCECIRDDVSFDTAQTAIESAQRDCGDSGRLGIVADADNIQLIEADVSAMMDGGRAKANAAAALSDFRRLLQAARGLQKSGAVQNGEFYETFTAAQRDATAAFTRGQLRAAVRKIDYFLAFVNDVYRS